jgi:predicted Zn finger-like uncharacterized protein
MFKVVADQLKISDGWVRCGHCAEIFDATADLRDDTQLEPAPAAAEPAAAAPEPPPVDDPEPTLGFASSLHTQVDDSAIDDIHDPEEIAEQAKVLTEHPLDQPFELRRADVSELPDEPGDEEALVGPHGFSRPSPLEPEPEPQPEREPELHDLGFVRQARRQEFWRRPGVRAALVLLLVVLAALLAGQVMYRDRDRLAVSSPALRPWLARMCAVLRCRLGPPLQIDAIAIETSTFNKVRADTYRLNVTLKNQAANEVAMPSLELTLTDSQDQPVVRRVLQPAEFAPGRAALPSGDWSTSVAVAVDANGGAGRIAGYRLLAFYP